MTCLALTPGEPSGIGPDLTIHIAQAAWPVGIVAIADPDLLRARAEKLQLPLTVETCDVNSLPQQHTPGTLHCLPISLNAPAVAGTLNPANVEYVLKTLQRGAQSCLAGHCDALVTGPVHKGVINDAGTPFTGQTEFIAKQCGNNTPVMMLAAETLRVALLTTHLPLCQVPQQITKERISQVVNILQHDLIQRFKIPSPRILVCGLNPHAGENGHLGREEIDVIIPALDALREEGVDVQGPLPADTLFTPHYLEKADAILAMYHDQGLAPLKALAFGKAINITLGLPIIRTSVDHGTALDLAGTGQANPSSLRCALEKVIALV